MLTLSRSKISSKIQGKLSRETGDSKGTGCENHHPIFSSVEWVLSEHPLNLGVHGQSRCYAFIFIVLAFAHLPMEFHCLTSKRASLEVLCLHFKPASTPFSSQGCNTLVPVIGIAISLKPRTLFSFLTRTNLGLASIQSQI